jgi:hypothetical protein
MTSRLSTGIETANNWPLGFLALAADYFPIRLLGLEVAVSMPVHDQPVTIGEMILLEWHIGSFASGAGVGMAQSFAKSILPGDHPGIVHHILIDAWHVSFDFTPHLTARLAMGVGLRLNEDDYCSAHPSACPQLADFPLTANLALFYNFDLTSGK